MMEECDAMIMNNDDNGRMSFIEILSSIERIDPVILDAPTIR
jgi:hypothetical protein